MTALRQTCSAFITVHDRTRPSEHEWGDYISAVVVISRERVFLALPEHIKALSGQNYWLPDGSGSPGRPWMPFAELLTYLLRSKLSLSRKEPLGFTASTAPRCLFFCSAHYLFNRSERRSRGDLVNSHQVLSHSIKKDGSFSNVVGLATPTGRCDSYASRECPQCHSSHYISCLQTQISPFCRRKKQKNIINDGWRFFCSFEELEMNRKFTSRQLPFAE